MTYGWRAVWRSVGALSYAVLLQAVTAGGPTDAQFRRLETDHFVVESDAGPEDAEAFGRRLESNYQRIVGFARDLGVAVREPEMRMAVTLYGRFDDFRRAGRDAGLDAEALPGFYDQTANRSTFCNVEQLPQVQRIPASSARDVVIEQIHQLVIAHEATHQVLFNIGFLTRGADHPEWWVEGLACLFEAPASDPSAPGPSPNRLRLEDLREAVSASRHVELIDLISASPHREADRAATRTRYAQSWGLMEYLRQRDAAAFAAFAKLQAAKAPHDPPQSASQRRAEFEARFGPVDDGAFLEWVRNLP